MTLGFSPQQRCSGNMDYVISSSVILPDQLPAAIHTPAATTQARQMGRSPGVLPANPQTTTVINNLEELCVDWRGCFEYREFNLMALMQFHHGVLGSLLRLGGFSPVCRMRPTCHGSVAGWSIWRRCIQWGHCLASIWNKSTFIVQLSPHHKGNILKKLLCLCSRRMSSHC